MKKQLFTLLLLAIVFAFASCEKDDNIVDLPSLSGLTLNCVKPAYLKAGDRVALISPSYYTPMENIEKTADVLRGW